MSDTANTTTAVALAHDNDTYVIAREKHNKDGTIARITAMDSVGILRSGSKAERCEMADSAMQRAIASCNFVSALHNMRRVWPPSALLRKSTEPLAGTVVGKVTFAQSGYQFVTFGADKRETHEVYSATCNKAATALMYARAIVQKAKNLTEAGKAIRGEKALVLQDARAVIKRIADLEDSRVARGSQAERRSPALGVEA